MARGKQTCKILKEIRRQIAEANDIEFITSECRYKGDCLGTCPKCEAEVRYLEQQLHTRSLSGKAVAIAGISAGVILMSGCNNASTNRPNQELQGEPQVEMAQTPDSLEHFESKVSDHDDIITKQGEMILEGDVAQMINPDEHGIYETVDKKPEFPGGQMELYKFIQRNIQYPKDLGDVEGRVYVQFYVDTVGKIHDIKVIRGICPELDKEAVRVVGLLPDFIPGEIYDKNAIPVVGEVEGKKVNTYFILPLLFRLQ